MGEGPEETETETEVCYLWGNLSIKLPTNDAKKMFDIGILNTCLWEIDASLKAN
jgi:hypothetical protein